MHSTQKLPLLRLTLTVACCSTMLLWRPTARAAEYVAVSSAVSGDYVRTKLPDGSYQPETYAFGDGGRMTGTMRGDSVDNLTFIDVARVISRPLAHRSYVPATDRNPENTKLLIMVYWGTTRGTAGGSGSDANEKLQDTQPSTKSPPPNPSSVYTAHCSCDATTLRSNNDNADVGKGATESSFASSLAEAAAANRERIAADMQNAVLLGYDSELTSADRHEPTAFSGRRDDLLAEVESNRHFVVLKAYDFQALWKHKKHRLLWVTRLSIRDRGTNFGSVLAAMVNNASQYFGQDSRGLMHTAVPDGHVEIGEVKTLAMGGVPGK